MKLPAQVTLKDISHSEAIEKKIHRNIDKLEKFCSRIMACRVIVESTQRRHHQGKLFTVRIDVTIPGTELVVNRIENEDLYVAIRDAFDAAKRQVDSHSRKQRGDVKVHEEPPRGRVTKLFPDDGYGFIETSDGREIYFHQNSVIDPTFERLEEGELVVFLEEQGKKGPQAVRVSISR